MVGRLENDVWDSYNFYYAHQGILHTRECQNRSQEYAKDILNITQEGSTQAKQFALQL